MHDFDLYKVLEIDYVHDKYTHTCTHTHPAPRKENGWIT